MQTVKYAEESLPQLLRQIFICRIIVICRIIESPGLETGVLNYLHSGRALGIVNETNEIHTLVL